MTMECSRFLQHCIYHPNARSNTLRYVVTCLACGCLGMLDTLLLLCCAGAARMTNGTTAHLLDFTAASANHFGRHSSAAKRASAAGSLMDDDMQVRSSDVSVGCSAAG